jgi:hypothetical protein
VFGELERNGRRLDDEDEQADDLAPDADLDDETLPDVASADTPL